MIALIQRVTSASVTVDGHVIGQITEGLLVLTGVEKGDDQASAEKLAHRTCGYRIFADEQHKMNLNVVDVGASLLLVPQFTLAANTKKGMRPSFSSAASGPEGEHLFDYFVEQARTRVKTVQTGQFGADMQVSLVNDGPVTFWLQV